MNEEFDLIPVSALNQYDYCPRRCWLIHVAGEFLPNPYTVEGELLHERTDRNIVTQRGDLLQLRHVQIYSHRLGLIGYADLVEEKEGELYPVEYKRGRKGNWQNDQLQLCAQALCLEEMTERAITRGYVYYAASHRREPVEFTDELRQLVVETVANVRGIMSTTESPASVPGPRCRGCSLYPVCLPRETDKLKNLPIEEDIT